MIAIRRGIGCSLGGGESRRCRGRGVIVSVRLGSRRGRALGRGVSCQGVEGGVGLFLVETWFLWVRDGCCCCCCCCQEDIAGFHNQISRNTRVENRNGGNDRRKCSLSSSEPDTEKKDD